MNRWRVSGLVVASEIVLPFFSLSSEATPDVTIYRGRVELPQGSIDRQGAVQSDSQRTIIQFGGVGRFLVERGQRIVVDAEPGCVDEVLAPSLLGACLAVLLHQRGCVVLHASGIIHSGAVVGFVGDSTWGKSTLVSHLLDRGYPFVTDDILPIDVASMHVFPGPPWLKIATDGNRKEPRVVDLPQDAEPLPVRTLFILDPTSPDNSVTSIPPSESVIELVRHSFCSTLLAWHGEADHFRACAAIAREVCILRLGVKRDLSRLDEVVNLVEKIG